MANERSVGSLMNLLQDSFSLLTVSSEGKQANSMLPDSDGSVLSEPIERAKKRVRFGDAVVHYHPIILGDSPSATVGTTPITIGWESFLKETMELKDACSKQAKSEMKIAPQERFRLARAAGYSIREIKKAKSASTLLHRAITYNIRNAQEILSNPQRDLDCTASSKKQSFWKSLVPSGSRRVSTY